MVSKKFDKTGAIGYIFASEHSGLAIRTTRTLLCLTPASTVSPYYTRSQPRKEGIARTHQLLIPLGLFPCGYRAHKRSTNRYES
jgi:hypothetical protein